MAKKGLRSAGVLALLAAALMLATTLVWTASANSAPRDRTVKIQVLTTNDFHSRLNPQSVGGLPAGGAAWLAAYLERAERQPRRHPDTRRRRHGGRDAAREPVLRGQADYRRGQRHRLRRRDLWQPRVRLWNGAARETGGLGELPVLVGERHRPVHEEAL